MNCFVTGATGFIGSRLVEKLSAEGHEVYCLIRSPEKFNALRGEHTHLVLGDLDDFDALLRGCKDCEVVYHLAAYAKVWSKDKNMPYKINVQGTINLLEASLKNGVKKFIFTSSAAVFGPSEDSQMIDEHVVRNTPYFNDYEYSKAMAEEFALEFLQRGLAIVILNPTRVFGPGPINESNSITKIIELFQKGRWRIIPGSGIHIGNYAYIDDVVEAMVAASSVPDINRMVINVGSGKETSINDLVKKVLEITGAKPEIVTNQSHDSGPSRMRADLAIAKKKLNFSPKYNLEKGILKTIEKDVRFQKK